MSKRLLLLTLLLTGCATTYWDGGDGTRAGFDKDSFECELATYRPAGAPPYATPAAGSTLTGASQSLYNLSDSLFYRAAQDKLFARCMQVRGYRLVTR